MIVGSLTPFPSCSLSQRLYPRWLQPGRWALPLSLAFRLGPCFLPGRGRLLECLNLQSLVLQQFYFGQAWVRGPDRSSSAQTSLVMLTLYASLGRSTNVGQLLLPQNTRGCNAPMATYGARLLSWKKWVSTPKSNQGHTVSGQDERQAGFQGKECCTSAWGDLPYVEWKVENSMVKGIVDIINLGEERLRGTWYLYDTTPWHGSQKFKVEN